MSQIVKIICFSFIFLDFSYGVIFFPRSFEADNFDDAVDNNNNKSCKCIPSYFCADDEQGGIFGEGLLDIRSSRNTCPNYFEVCCENPMKNIPKKNEFIKVDNYPGCGYNNMNSLSARITSGSLRTLLGELPWTAAVLLKDKVSKSQHFFKCGGSLIHPQVVLTAAHCISGFEARELLIRAGEWDTQSLKEPIPHQDINVQEVAIHPQYNERSLKNDIGLLFLTNEVLMLDNVGIICLPPQSYQVENTRCTASGWGKNAFQKGTHSTVLKKIDLPLISSTECQQALRNTRLGPLFILHESFLCAGGEKNKDTCQGDGGSPLVCPVQGPGGVRNGRYFQAGIVSWGIGCGGTKTPGVYVNTAMFTDWIDSLMRARSFDVDAYKF